jgi:DNA-binding response OmpR family regulator
MATRVLVIDDEAPIRLLCRVNLEAEGMEVLEAADGTTGVELARRHRPDAILLDVMMPGVDGWRVAEQLTDDADTGEIPIVFLTARAEVRDRARGLDVGGVDYVTKPFNPLDLAAVVRRLLDRPRHAHEGQSRRQHISHLRALMERD